MENRSRSLVKVLRSFSPSRPALFRLLRLSFVFALGSIDVPAAACDLISEMQGEWFSGSGSADGGLIFTTMTAPDSAEFVIG
jgi:hypothetical protein